MISGSGSSGRMSTISGCSMGDSGTHSDHEERKVIKSWIHIRELSKPEFCFSEYFKQFGWWWFQKRFKQSYNQFKLHRSTTTKTVQSSESNCKK